jgi:hypothetical protein
MSNYFDKHLDLAINESLDEGPIDYMKDVVGNIKQRRQEKRAQKLKQQEAMEIKLVNSKRNWVGLYNLRGTLKTDTGKKLLRSKIAKYKKTKEIDPNEQVPQQAYSPGIYDENYSMAHASTVINEIGLNRINQIPQQDSPVNWSVVGYANADERVSERLEREFTRYDTPPGESGVLIYMQKGQEEPHVILNNRFYNRESQFMWDQIHNLVLAATPSPGEYNLGKSGIEHNLGKSGIMVTGQGSAQI